MRFFIENQKIEKEVEWIKSQLKLHMNGATTAQMEESGIYYRINYGVGIPHLKQLAKRISESFELAERLWFSEVREMMLLASMIVPAQQMTEEVCRDWSKQITNKDLVERTSMYLWARIDNILSLLKEWLGGDNAFLKATAFYAIGRQLQLDSESITLSAAELIKEADKCMDLYTIKALSFVLRMKIRHCYDEKEEINAYVKVLSASGEKNYQILAEELISEIDFIDNK